MYFFIWLCQVSAVACEIYVSCGIIFLGAQILTVACGLCCSTAHGILVP